LANVPPPPQPETARTPTARIPNFLLRILSLALLSEVPSMTRRVASVLSAENPNRPDRGARVDSTPIGVEIGPARSRAKLSLRFG
jgi:hypothetical protein